MVPEPRAEAMPLRETGSWKDYYLLEELESSESEQESSDQESHSAHHVQERPTTAIQSFVPHDVTGHRIASPDTSGSEAEENEEQEIKDAQFLLPQRLTQPSAALRLSESPAAGPSVAAYKILPWSQLTRAEKKNARRRERAKKTKLHNKIKRDVQDTGVVAAGRFAQAKRGIFAPMSSQSQRVVTGRVRKRVARDSERQILLSRRKRLLDSSKPAVRTQKTKKKKTKDLS